MKKKLLPVMGLLAVGLLGCVHHDRTKDSIQNKTYIVTMTGIDSLQLHMSLSEVEKILQAKVPLKHIGNGGYNDTIPVKFKGIDMMLYLDGDSATTSTLRGIETSSMACKTAAGIGTASDKMSVINAYPDNLKYVAPEYDVYPNRSRTKSAVAVMDTLESRAMVFHIVNKKVVSVEVQSFYEFY